MPLYKPVRSSKPDFNIRIQLETGHIVNFKIIPKVFIDLEREESGQPFVWVNFDNEYTSIEETDNSMSLEEIRERYKDTNLLTSDLVYDHIQIGFIYSDGDPNNHRWMLNFMDVNNKFLFGFNGDNVKVNCPFTTMSWEDGIWHGRFVVSKNHIKELLEPEPGQFIINGEGDIGNQLTQPLEEDYDHLSLRYNIQENTWYAEVLKDSKIVGSFPCKNIICDVPFEGKIDKSSSKPKVTALLKKEDIKGISLALNALIIKKI